MNEGIVVHDKLSNMYQESGWQPPRYHDALTFSEFPVHCASVRLVDTCIS